MKQNSGRKRKLSDRDCRTLRWIVTKDHKNTAPKITAKLNGHLENPVSSKTVRRELHKAGYDGGRGCNKKNILKWIFKKISRCFFVQPCISINVWDSNFRYHVNGSGNTLTVSLVKKIGRPPSKKKKENILIWHYIASDDEAPVLEI